MGVGEWGEGHGQGHELLLEHTVCYGNVNMIR